jgi:hypothetical protein
MPKKMARVVPPSELTVKNLEAPYYLVTVEMVCTGNVPHQRVVHRSELPTNGPPICMENNCGMPMVVASTTAMFGIKSLNLSIKGDTTPRKRTRRVRGKK